MARNAAGVAHAGVISLIAVMAAAGTAISTQYDALSYHGTHTRLPAPRDTFAVVTITGTVRNAQTNSAIQFAAVLASIGGRAVSPVVPTAKDGTYRVQLTRIPRGAQVVLSARAIGYRADVAKLVANSDSLSADIALSTDVSRLSEMVVSSQAAARVERAPVGFSVAAGNVAAASPPPMMSGKSVAGVGRELRARDDRQRIRAHDRVSDLEGNREQYDRILDNPFLAVRGNPLSTFSVDVDRASYGNVRRFISQGQLPPADAVRIEEMVNYFPYTLAEPRGDAPVAITTEAVAAPWQPKHQLVRVALQARRIETDKLPASNLVFLIDVSGSMSSPDKLPLVKASLRLLVEQLREKDRVAMVVYAGAAGLVLPSTSGAEKSRIMEAIDRLEAGGSTAGGAGLELAYRTAREHFEREGNNRVILATDGDFNVGVSSDAAMERLIESKRAEGTYLTVLGFGTGNYQDAKMEKMAKVGNGNYAYVDDIAEARKVLVKEMGATLVTVANDVKLQVEFNPTRVAAYRLIGYEDRLLRDEDFNDDKKDAGDMGAGHTVTAMYELVPVGVKGTVKLSDTDALRYTPTEHASATADSPSRTQLKDDVRATPADDDELLYVKLRYKTPGDSKSKLIAKAVRTRDVRDRATDDFRFASSVAAFGMLMRNSEYKGNTTVEDVLRLARSADDDEAGYRGEFIDLVERWQTLSRKVATRMPRRD